MKTSLRQSLYITFTLFILLAAAWPAYANTNAAPAAVHTVGVTFTCDFPTLQDAVNAAAPGDEIRLAGITFSGASASAIITKELTVTGGYNPFCTAPDSTPTTLDATGQAASVLQISANTTLNNLVVVGGAASTFGGGIRVELADVTLDNVTVRDSEAVNGGGVSIHKGELLVSNSQIYGNVASDSGGGIHCEEGEVVLAAGAEIGRFFATPLGNVAQKGGGIFANECVVNLNNDAAVFGNSAESGGGLYATDLSFISANNSPNSHLPDVHSNTATDGSGGGIHLDESTLAWSIGSIRANQASTNGGGVYAGNDSIVSIEASVTICPERRCVVIGNNKAGIGSGGALYATESAVLVRRAYLENNEADQRGGAIYFASPTATISPSFQLQHSYITNNKSGINYAVRIFNTMGEPLNTRLDHLTFVENRATDSLANAGYEIGVSGALYPTGQASSAPFRANGWLVDGQQTGTIAFLENIDQFEIYCSLLPHNSWSGSNNVLSNSPKFLDPSNNDYRVAIDSPAVDNCPFEPDAFDADGEPLGYDAPAPLGNLHPNLGTADSGADEVRALIGINGALCAYETVREALDASAAGDTLYVGSDIGGAIGNITNTVTIHGASPNCTSLIGSTDPKPDLTPGGDSGRVFELASGTTLTLTRMSVRNGVDDSGGNIAITNGSTLVLSQTLVTDGTALTGGGIALEQATLIAMGSNLLRNEAIDGGAIHAVDSSISMASGSLWRNSATRNGGAVHLSKSDFTASAFARLTLNAAIDGAAIYAQGADGTSDVVLADNSSIGQPDEGNMASGNGGGVYLADKFAQLRLFGVAMVQHNAAANGAGVYSNDATVHFVGGTTPSIHNNAASGNGGGAYVTGQNAELDMNAGAVFNNTAAANGGGVYLINEGDVLVSGDATIYGNNAVNGGGGYVAGSDTRMVLSDDATLADNVAILGGGAFVNAGAQLLLQDQAVIVGNRAGSGAGAYVAGSAMVNVSGAGSGDRPEFRENVALTGSGRGGGLYVEQSVASTLIGADFVGNQALFGGGTYVSGGILSMRNVMMAENSAETGAGLAVRNGAKLTIAADMTSCDPTALAGERYCSEFFNNSSPNSSAIDIKDSTLTVSHTSFNVNHGTVADVGTVIDIVGASDVTLDTVLLSASFSHAAAIRVGAAGTPVSLMVRNSTVAKNDGFPLQTDDDTLLTIERSIIWGNDDGVQIDAGTTFSADCNMTQGVATGSQAFGSANNFVNIDPMFAATARGSYFLMPNSPAIDVCDGGNALDLENVSRPNNGDGVASSAEFDIGAFEYADSVPTAVGLGQAGVADGGFSAEIITLTLIVLTTLVGARQAGIISTRR